MNKLLKINSYVADNGIYIRYIKFVPHREHSL